MSDSNIEAKVVDISKVRSITVVPAFGRGYTELEPAKVDWERDKDFRIITLFPKVPTGRYINKSDVLRLVSKATVTLMTKEKIRLGVLYYGR